MQTSKLNFVIYFLNIICDNLNVNIIIAGIDKIKIRAEQSRAEQQQTKTLKLFGKLYENI